MLIRQHQSVHVSHPGGLGVPSSNLGAPTNKIRHFLQFWISDSSQKWPLGAVWEESAQACSGPGFTPEPEVVEQLYLLAALARALMRAIATLPHSMVSPSML
jgi:hypothetical protein